MNEVARLARGSIRRHLVLQTLPMIIGVAAIMSVGLVDAYFIGRLGSAELAAVSFVFPVGVATASLGVGMMVAINSVVARALGANDVDRARTLASFGIVFALAMGCLIGGALYALVEPLFTLMQAQSDLLPLIGGYVRPYAAGVPLLLLQMALNGVLRGQGEARKTSYVSMTFAIANWILDPLLIGGGFGFEGFGIAGAAYATAIGWLLAIAMAWWMLRRTPVRPVVDLIARGGLADALRAIGKVAGPAAFSNAINPIGLTVLTSLVASQSQAAVAGFGAAGRLQSFAVVPLLALSGSIGAIVGQNWGAGQHERAREAWYFAGGFSLAYGLAMAVLLVAAGDWFVGFFSNDPQVAEQFKAYLAIAAWGYAGYGVLIVGNGVLNAVDRAEIALAQSLARVFLVMLPFAWLLRESWGTSAAYAAELAANLIGGGIAGAMVWRILRRRTVLREAARVTLR